MSRKTKIRVMHLVHQLGAGGAENGIINIVNNIDQHNFQISIATFVDGGALSQRVQQEKCERFTLNKREGNDLLLPFKLRKLFQTWQPHILHTHAWGTLCEGVIGAKLARIPIIIHGEHGTIQEKPINVFVQRQFWRMTNHVLSMSNEHRQRLSSIIGFPESRIVVIPNGVASNCFSNCLDKQSAKKKLGFPPDSFIIGTVGRLVPIKNQKMLIKAFASIAEQYPDTRLLMVGDGPLREELATLAATLNVSSRVTFAGRRNDVPKQLQAMDLFVLPSLSEGMSNTLLEAMSTGIPVIATNVGGNPEVITNRISGMLVKSDDPCQLAATISKLIDNKKLRIQMGQEGRKQIEIKFSLAAMVGNYENLYETLYEGNKRC